MGEGEQQQGIKQIDPTTSAQEEGVKQPENPINNGEKTEVSRSEIYQEKLGGKFKVGNPGGGKPKGSFSLLAILKSKLQECPEGQDKKTYAELVVMRMLKESIEKGDVQQMRLIWNYIEGMPRLPIDFNDETPKVENKLVDLLKNCDDETRLQFRRVFEKLNGRTGTGSEVPDIVGGLDTGTDIQSDSASKEGQLETGESTRGVGQSVAEV